MRVRSTVFIKANIICRIFTFGIYAKHSLFICFWTAPLRTNTYYLCGLLVFWVSFVHLAILPYFTSLFPTWTAQMISIYCWFSKESHINTLLGTFLSQRGSHYLGKWGFSFIRVLCYKAVLDCLNYYNKIPQIGWFVNNRNVFLTVLEVGKSRIKAPAWLSSLVRALFLIHS